jgi:hypothetical protein
MNIEIRVRIETIFAINRLLQGVYEAEVPMEVTQKIYRSMGFELADKFDKIQKSNIKKPTLFDYKKLHKITLKFHEG